MPAGPIQARPRHATLCIFCGRRARLTAEHVWPRWFRDVVPRFGTKAPRTGHILIRYPSPTEPPTVGQGRMARPGELADRGLRVVCGFCNNGWMGSLQTRARPVLEPLMRGIAVPLSSAAQEVMAAWATMATMVIEYSDFDTVAVTEGERDAFYRSQQALPGWRIWIGLNGGMSAVFYHAALAVGSEQPPHDGSQRPNTQTTTLGFGKLVLQTFSSTAELPSGLTDWLAGNLPSSVLQIIWPPLQGLVTVPSHALSNAEFVAVGKLMSEGLIAALNR